MLKTADHLLKLCMENKVKLSVAESCTGGAVAVELTKVSGALDYFLGALVAYCIPIKIKILNVPEQLIQEYGVVSAQVAEKMAEGALQLFDCDFALSTTGLAGPTGGTKQCPIGTVYFGLASKRKQNSISFHSVFSGSRSEIIQLASQQAIDHLYKVIKT